MAPLQSPAAWAAALVAASVLPRGDGWLDIWATEEKIWREELRPADQKESSLWDSQDGVRLTAGRNEVVSFALVLEARGEAVSDVAVDFQGLPGLRTRQRPLRDGAALFDWREVEIELFYVRYLQVRGIGKDFSYDERLLPPRMQRPWTPGYRGAGVGVGNWSSRRGAMKHWPEIAVPLELHRHFSISANSSQMVWVDVFVPRGFCSGRRSGSLTVASSSGTVSVGVTLNVRRFTLPDEPTSKTMLPLEGGDILRRYTGQNWVHCALQHETRALFDRHYQLAWRHKVSMVGGSFDACVAEAAPRHDEPHGFDVDRLSGRTFTAAMNYSGPGQGVGVGIFPVGLYGSWRRYWEKEGPAGVQLHAQRWRSWFERAGAPFNTTEVFLYLIDESANYTQTQLWAEWAAGSLRSMATLPLPEAVARTPALDIACSTIGFASKVQYEEAIANASRRGRPALWAYNGGRPAAGGLSIEEEASAPRSIPWAMYKKHVQRYFYWMSTYYTNYQASLGPTDVFTTAKTFGRIDVPSDPQKGETGWMYGNGDGVLIYPGTDMDFPASSYGVPGPFAGLRLKYWRRGLQDIEYLELLKKRRGEEAVRLILSRLIPKVLWEVDVPDPGDPTWARTNTSWPEAWEDWERVRLEIADLIEEAASADQTCRDGPPEPPQAPAPPPCDAGGGALELALGAGGSLRVWATEEKVLREEQWADCHSSRVRSSLWNGSAVVLFGARQEVVSFAVALEARGRNVLDVHVEFPALGALRSRPVPSSPKDLNDTLFDWRRTEVELFYVRYLQIRGVSGNGYSDERLFPRRMQRPWMAASGGGGLSGGSWKDRPGANRHYPEIAVPLELHPLFNISANESQMIWVDVFIPRDFASGVHLGELTVSVGLASLRVPVQLRVHDFTLPDRPTSKTMVPYEGGDILRRYIGRNWLHCSLQHNDLYRRLWDRHYQVAWRHRIQLVGGSFDDCKRYNFDMGYLKGDWEILKDTPEEQYVARMNGSCFTAERNYSGPGQNLSIDLFPIGLYGSWSRQNWNKNASGSDIGFEAGFALRLGRWESWFRNSASANVRNTERFLYLIDESTDYVQTENWGHIIEHLEGNGSAVPSMATISLPAAVKSTPSLDIACSTVGFCNRTEWNEALASARQLGMRLWLYNGGRPAHGSTNIEGEAVDMRTIPWALFKHGVERYFYWMSTYYTNYQAGEGGTNVFQRAKTFGVHGENSSTLGEHGWMYGNGDGVLLYPGTDREFPIESYDVWGPFASLRLKYWRRGLQDVDYLELLRQRCGESVAQATVARVMPAALWEAGEEAWFPEISWPLEWDAWEKVRAEVAKAVESNCTAGRPTAPGRCVRLSARHREKIERWGFRPVASSACG